MFNSAVFKFDEQWKLKTLADSDVLSPVVVYASWIHSHLADYTIDYRDALTLWVLRN